VWKKFPAIRRRKRRGPVVAAPFEHVKASVINYVSKKETPVNLRRSCNYSVAGLALLVILPGGQSRLVVRLRQHIHTQWKAVRMLNLIDELTRSAWRFALAPAQQPRCDRSTSRGHDPARDTRVHSLQWPRVRGQGTAQMAGSHRSQDVVYRIRLSLEKGYCESFNSKLRERVPERGDHLLVEGGQLLAERWRVYYNTARPHSSLDTGHLRLRPGKWKEIWGIEKWKAKTASHFSMPPTAAI